MHDVDLKDALPEGTGQPEEPAELRDLYAAFEREHIMPLWTQRDDLMPFTPQPKAVPHVWRWADILPMAERSGELVPVGRGGERRALGLANPGLGGNAYVAPTFGRRSSIWGHARPHLSIATRRTLFVSWSRARGCGRSLMATLSG
ncbi:hypothetical protein [Nitratireductor aquibiodomus]|uniref:hypothetical protein n=1 Tax=Nitratireductor aquibiodomus TaxID=204799 RepID=UPI001FCACCD1|nr:hypothetical protein [Nitratireductor aquibiodomus]